VSEEVLALIPARGGSKGIPGKNLIEIAGKPLIAWSILQARAASCVQRVVVSTDDPLIAAVAAEWGADVPFLRPAELAQDLSPDIDVFRHALETLATAEQYRPTMVVHLRATAPVRDVADIDKAVALLAEDPDADAVRSVSQARQSPFKMWVVNEDGTMTPVARVEGMTDCQSQARQLLPVAYTQNGYVDVVRPRAVMEQNSMWGSRVLAFVVETELFDLDYPEDIPPVEAALHALDAGGDIPRPPAGRHPV
jgi:N-acylneuraminate cytidylyltransferase